MNQAVENNAPTVDATPVPTTVPAENAAPLPTAETGGLEPSVETSSDSESEVNWGDLNEDFLAAEKAEETPSIDVETTTPVKAAAVTTPKPGAAVAPPVQAPVPTQAVAEQPVIPPQPTSTPDTVPPVAPVSDAAPLDFAKARADMLANIEQSYAMTEEDGLALLNTPEKVLPKLAAQVQLNVIEQTIRQVASMLPQFLEQHNRQQQVRTDNQTAFFKEWPDLNKPEYNDTLTRIAITYRQQNPTASSEKAIKEIGAIAAISLGVTPKQFVQAAQPNTPPQPVFTPAMPGGGNRPAQAPSTNEFTQLADNWGDE